MHCAICDDNIGDRKQLERLLKRESDKHDLTAENIYTDSFGSYDTLLANPMQYDVFYIDMCHTEGVTGTDVVNMLLQAGVNAPIVLCISDIDYRSYDFPDNILFLQKAIKVEELRESIRHALAIKDAAPKLIELRDDNGTYYCEDQDILYSVEKGRYCHVALKNGTVVDILTDTYNMFTYFTNHPSFFCTGSKTILNAQHIKSIHLGKAVMSDGASFKIALKHIQIVKTLMEEYGL